jgi:putative ABC transport system permease protein
MFDIDKWQEIYLTVKKHKLRTLLTAFGVFWGIFMLVLLLGAGKGLENGTMNMFGDTAKNSMYVWGGVTSQPYKGTKPGRFIQFTNDDVDALRVQVKEIEFLNPNIDLDNPGAISYKTKNGTFSISGDLPDLRRIKTMNILQGRFVNDIDITEKRKVAIIGQRVQQVLFGDANPIGEYIKVKGAFFKVVGVFKPKNSGGDGRRDGETIYIPLPTLQQTFNVMNKVGMFIATVKLGNDAKDVELKIKSILATRHNVAPFDERAIGSWNAQEEFKKFQGLFAAINIFIWVVGIGTIIAGIVGVSNIMLIIVKERTKEIGVRKALGATPWSVISLIIQESVVITAVSGYMGLVCGVGIIEGLRYAMEKFEIQNEFFSNLEIDFKVAIFATILLVVTGSLAGLIPARKAAKINPIEALRTD